MMWQGYVTRSSVEPHGTQDKVLYHTLFRAAILGHADLPLVVNCPSDVP